MVDLASLDKKNVFSIFLEIKMSHPNCFIIFFDDKAPWEAFRLEKPADGGWYAFHPPYPMEGLLPLFRGLPSLPLVFEPPPVAAEGAFREMLKTWENLCHGFLMARI